MGRHFRGFARFVWPTWENSFSPPKCPTSVHILAIASPLPGFGSLANVLRGLSWWRWHSYHWAELNGPLLWWGTPGFPFTRHLHSTGLTVLMSVFTDRWWILPCSPLYAWYPTQLKYGGVFVELMCKWMDGWIRMGKVKVKVTQSCLTLCDPMDYLVRRIPQARILEWVTFPFSRGSSQPRDWTQVSRIAGRFFTSWATREAQE